MVHALLTETRMRCGARLQPQVTRPARRRLPQGHSHWQELMRQRRQVQLSQQLMGIHVQELMRRQFQVQQLMGVHVQVQLVRSLA